MRTLGAVVALCFATALSGMKLQHFRRLQVYPQGRLIVNLAKQAACRLVAQFTIDAFCYVYSEQSAACTCEACQPFSKKCILHFCRCLLLHKANSREVSFGLPSQALVWSAPRASLVHFLVRGNITKNVAALRACAFPRVCTLVLTMLTTFSTVSQV